MPVHNVHPSGLKQTAHDFLQEQGLLLGIEISASETLAAALHTNGKSIPQPISGDALVDTGASCCCVEESHLISLGLQPIGQTEVRSPNGIRSQNLYFVRLTFPGTPIPPLELRVVGVQMNQGTTISLIGRDVLRHYVLIYNGPMGCYTIAF